MATGTKTFSPSAKAIVKSWQVVDVADRPLGRVASEIASLLRGKHKPEFVEHLDIGDFVIVVNAEKVKLTGRKAETKIYYRHSGYHGGLKETSFERMRDKAPQKVIEKAVWGMLPKTRLGRQQLRHLKVYPGPSHPHEAQVRGSQKAAGTGDREQ
ncbi:MAG: 50S ribosomal protein L13 [Dehalococcoidia bacterium]|nr:50S ribosomal protein L13 [Dehalococcoidia bacterium]